MKSEATSVEEYISSLHPERQEVIEKLRDAVRQNLPEGFEESMSYGMIGYSVPLSIYPKGYQGKGKQPLPFIHIASQKNHVALYHMGLYTEKPLLEWFEEDYQNQTGSKPDIGKSCLRFKKMNKISYRLIAELSTKMTPREWAAKCDQMIRKK